MLASLAYFLILYSHLISSPCLRVVGAGGSPKRRLTSTYAAEPTPRASPLVILIVILALYSPADHSHHHTHYYSLLRFSAGQVIIIVIVILAPHFPAGHPA